VFSDLVGVPDADVTAYGREIVRQIEGRYSALMDHFALEDLFGAGNFNHMRAELVTHYAEPLEAIRERTADHARHQSLFNGMHRFLSEEYPNPGGELSKTKVRELCKPLTYEVIRRSDAWGRLIAECFPAALRLSIHPQDPHGEKIGIRLGDADDAWITPWHGVAVERPDGTWTLRKRREAEAESGAELVSDADGRPSHIRVRAVGGAG
jgi:pyoverdine/dityrosine biosynthesis protein Dit1